MNKNLAKFRALIDAIDAVKAIDGEPFEHSASGLIHHDAVDEDCEILRNHLTALESEICAADPSLQVREETAERLAFEAMFQPEKEEVAA